MSSGETDRVPYNEDDNNGMILGDQYIPAEILTQIFVTYLDRATLLKCRLVCKRWHEFVQNYAWRKKAEIVNGYHILPHELSWTDQYTMYKKQPLNRNLVKNHSGEKGKLEHWKSDRKEYTVENPPVGMPPLPKDDVFGNSQYCFVTSYTETVKFQMIDLIAEGIPIHILEDQPTIMISEWYGCRWDCPAMYNIRVKLLDYNLEVLQDYTFSDTMYNERQNVWFQIKHEFKNYGKGLRYIRFVHGGKDRSFWAGYYGVKMARACVIVQSPKVPPEDLEEDEILE